MRRILPGLVAAAVRRGATGQWRVRPVFDDLTATAWMLVRTYPLERRPRRIAVNLLRDAEYQVCVRPFRLRAASEVVCDPHGTALEATGRVAADLGGRPLDRPSHSSDELTHVLAEGRRAGLTEEVAPPRCALPRGEAVGAAAARLGVSPRTILNRRLAATERLREVAA